MKKLLIFLSLIATTQAQLSVAVGIDTTHIRFNDNRDYTLNESNSLIAIEYEKNDHLISISIFQNSFFKDSWSINYRHAVGKGKFRFLTGVSLINGYNEMDLLPSKTVKDKFWCFDNPLYIGKWLFDNTYDWIGIKTQQARKIRNFTINQCSGQ